MRPDRDLENDHRGLNNGRFDEGPSGAVDALGIGGLLALDVQEMSSGSAGRGFSWAGEGDGRGGDILGLRGLTTNGGDFGRSAGTKRPNAKMRTL